MHRTTVLATAAKLTAEDRSEQHGDAVEQHTCAGEMAQVYLEQCGSKYSAAHNIAILQALIKISRIACGKPGNMDNYIDGAAYLAIAAECLPDPDLEPNEEDSEAPPGSPTALAVAAQIRAQGKGKKK